jgi:hypothetical protein
MNDDPKGQQIQGQPSDDVPASPATLGTPESRNVRPAAAPPGAPDSRIQGGSIRLFRAAGRCASPSLQQVRGASGPGTGSRRCGLCNPGGCYRN